MKYRYLGILDENIADYWGLQEHQNKPILVYDDRKEHVKENHLKDFGTIDELEKAYQNLANIIKKPDYVFYNQVTNGLEYYKRISSDVCVAVRINPGKVLKVKSWYPANPTKIPNRKKKEIELKTDENIIKV